VFYIFRKLITNANVKNNQKYKIKIIIKNLSQVNVIDLEENEGLLKVKVNAK
jgi:hypothetical protein